MHAVLVRLAAATRYRGLSWQTVTALRSRGWFTVTAPFLAEAHRLPASSYSEDSLLSLPFPIRRLIPLRGAPCPVPSSV